jgi:hypothetical protein
MKTSHFEAVLYEDDVYCIKCLPKGVTRKQVNPLDSREIWAQAPTCCVCGMEHYSEAPSGAPADLTEEEEEDEEDEDDALDGIEDDGSEAPAFEE